LTFALCDLIFMIQKIWKAITSVWRIKDVRRRFLFTFGFFIILRFWAHIPLPGVNMGILRKVFLGNQFLGLLNIFSGGTLSNFSITALGLGPYINASIVFQLLSFVFPYFERLSHEGEVGRQKIERYTKVAAVPLAVFQALGMYALLKGRGIIAGLDFLSLVAFISTMTAGTFLLIWLGGLISEYGLGNGISLLIFAGIVSQIPQELAQTVVVAGQGGGFLNLLAFLMVSLGVVVAIVWVNEANRRIPIQYAKRVRGRKMYGGQTTYLPLRLNQAGVIPIIFAVSVVLVPSMLGQFLGNVGSKEVRDAALFFSNLFRQDGITYNLAYFVLVVVFTFFYTMVVFNPEKIAGEIQKNGGFIPGIRPGRPTTDYLNYISLPTTDYLNYISLRVTLPGALFLGLVAVLPAITQAVMGVKMMVLGGTSILIIVSVVLETAKSVGAMVQMRGYDKFLEKY